MKKGVTWRELIVDVIEIFGVTALVAVILWITIGHAPYLMFYGGLLALKAVLHEIELFLK